MEKEKYVPLDPNYKKFKHVISLTSYIHQHIGNRSVTALPRVHHENSSNFQQSALKFNVFMKSNVDNTGDSRRASTDKKYRAYSI